MYQKIKNNIIEYTLITIGIVICIIQYFYNRSLWLDEASLANNIISRNFLELLIPLDHNQVAPIGFLFLTKLFSFTIPNSELGLRVFPLLSYIFSIILFYKTCKILFKNKLAIIFCLSLFVFNYTLIYYSSELKQYMSDVFVLLILNYTTIKYAQTITTQYLRLIVFGCICVFMSNITPLVLLSCGIYLIVINYKEIIKVSQIRKLILITFSFWLLTFIFYYLVFIHNHPAKDFMIQYWSNATAFLPNNPFDKSFWLFLLTKAKMVFTKLLSYGKIGVLFPLFYLLGFIKIFLYKNYRFIILFILPIIVHLTLSSFKLYPFDTRLILYSTSIYILIITIGFENLLNSKYLQKFNNAFINGLLPCLFFAYFLYSKPFPIKHEELKDALSYINRASKEAYPIYVYYGAKPALNYYKSINIFNQSNQLIFGDSSRDNRTKYIEQIKKINEPFWLLFSHPFSNEDKFIIQKLHSMGYNTSKQFEVNGASVYLFGKN